MTEAGFPPGSRDRLLWAWRFWGRPEQHSPPGDWRTWLYLAGRGSGKTRTGGELVNERVEARSAGRMALIGRTAADTRDVLVEGPSGVVARSPPWCRAVYEPSKRRVTWAATGAVATLYSADEPDLLRGPEHDLVWADELAAWRYVEAWENMEMGLRVGENPQAFVSTTPRPIPIVRKLLKDRTTVVTRGSTYDNAANLPAAFVEKILAKYKGTRLGRQEIEGEVLDEVQGALWTLDALDQLRVAKAPELQRIVVAVDPSGGQGAEHDEQGIVGVGVGVDDAGYLLADRTCSLSPEGWARRTVETALELKADAIVWEKNFGGAMVESTLQIAMRSLGATLRLVEVWASLGKHQRAEPIAALYEQKRFHHVGAFPELEDELCGFTPTGYVGDRSPNRADALIWAASECMMRKPVSFV